jgi:hypothetical protein
MVNSIDNKVESGKEGEPMGRYGIYQKRRGSTGNTGNNSNSSNTYESKTNENKNSSSTFNGLKRGAGCFLLGASLLGLASLGGLDYAVGKAYAEVENVRVSGDLHITEKRSNSDKTVKGFVYGPSKVETIRQGIDTKQDNKEEYLYNLVRNIKTFEYEGKMYKFLFVENVDNKRIIRQDKVVFCTNFLKEKEFNRYVLSDNKAVDMNYEIFTADVRDGKLTNITRVTKTIDKNECGPFWTDDENIA